MSRPHAYRVLSPLRHNGVAYRPGSPNAVALVLGPEAAARLLALGVIALGAENTTPGEAAPGTTQGAEIALADAGEKPRGGNGAAPGTGPAVVNINTATAPELAEAMTGVGALIAAQVVEHRLVYGPFRSVEALAEVRGIGAATVARHRNRLTV